MIMSYYLVRSVHHEACVIPFISSHVCNVGGYRASVNCELTRSYAAFIRVLSADNQSKVKVHSLCLLVQSSLD